jgi:hypothetical protein
VPMGGYVSNGMGRDKGRATPAMMERCAGVPSRSNAALMSRRVPVRVRPSPTASCRAYLCQATGAVPRAATSAAGG